MDWAAADWAGAEVDWEADCSATGASEKSKTWPRLLANDCASHLGRRGGLVGGGGLGGGGDGNGGLGGGVGGRGLGGGLGGDGGLGGGDDGGDGGGGLGGGGDGGGGLGGGGKNGGLGGGGDGGDGGGGLGGDGLGGGDAGVGYTHAATPGGGAGGGGLGSVTAPTQLGVVADAAVHAEVTFVVVLTTVIVPAAMVKVLAFAAHSAALPLTFRLVACDWLASSPAGTTPTSALFASAIVLAVSSCDSAQLIEPLSPRLPSCSTPTPPPQGFALAESPHVTPVQERPTPGALDGSAAHAALLVLPTHGAQGCRCHGSQLLRRLLLLTGSRAACASRRMSAIGRSTPMDVP